MHSNRCWYFFGLLSLCLLVAPAFLAQTDPTPTPSSSLQRNNSTITPAGDVLPLTLLSPVDGASSVSGLPLFQWTAHPDATDYTLIIKRNGKTKVKHSFGASYICEGTICTVDLASVSGAKALKVGKTYVWRIKTQDEASLKSSFIVDNTNAEFQPIASNALSHSKLLPTITPTPPPSAYLHPRTGSDVYVFHEIDNVTELKAGINTSNAETDPDKFHVLLLAANTYSLTSVDTPNSGRGLPIIARKLIIRGMNADFTEAAAPGTVIIQRYSLQSFDLFYNQSDLTLYDVTLQNGGGQNRNDGGAIMNGGTLNLYRTILQDNFVDYRGGAIYSTGSINMARGEFYANQAGLTGGNGIGGAIYHNSSGQVVVDTSLSDLSNPTIQVYCAQFGKYSFSGSGNYASASGGAVYMQGGSANLNYAKLLANAASPSGYGAIALGTGGGATASARYGWWSPGPSNTTGAVNSVSPAVTTAPASIAATGTPEPNLNYCRVPIPPQQLKEYKIELIDFPLNSDWAKNEILEAVQITGDGLARYSYRVSNIDEVSYPEVIFKRVMFDPYAFGGGTANRVIQIKIITQTPDKPVACSTNKDIYVSGQSNTIQAIIECDSRVISSNLLNRYTIIHELGHAFVGRTGNNTITNPIAHYSGKETYYHFTEVVNEFDRASFPNSRFVFGKRGLVGGTFDWQRSDILFDAGWGSAALPGTGICSGGNYTPPPGTPFAFQQNPCRVTGVDIAEVEEGAADMFLNWIYRNSIEYGPNYGGINQDGFLNREWDGVVGATPTSCYAAWSCPSLVVLPQFM